MNVFYEEDGSFKAGTVLADNTTSLQIETAHGKRIKLKANAVMVRFEGPAPIPFTEAAQALAADIDPGFLWEVAPQDEFDYLALGRNLPEPKGGDLLAIMTAGAYGAVQAGTYNTRALVPEVLVNGDQYAVVRPRIDVEALIAMDRVAPWL